VFFYLLMFVICREFSLIYVHFFYLRDLDRNYVCVWLKNLGVFLETNEG
jgi:hypothetical protein